MSSVVIRVRIWSGVSESHDVTAVEKNCSYFLFRYFCRISELDVCPTSDQFNVFCKVLIFTNVGWTV